MEDRGFLKFVIVGHIDHGKSTLIGRLLVDTDSIPYDKIKEIEESREKRMDGEIEFAFLVDHFREERERKITIDTVHTFFETPKRGYVIIDAPGHVEYVKNMISGASQAEMALLIVDVTEGVCEQTKRHANLLSMLGIAQVIVAINKMDIVYYKEEKFKRVSNEVRGFFTQIGMNADYYIPISALKGDNVATRSRKMDWYDGPNILQSLDSIKLGSTAEDKSLLFPIQDVYEIDGNRIAVGRVEAGRVEAGMEVKILPEGRKSSIKRIEKFQEDRERVVAGESIGVIIEDPNFIQRGSVMCVEGKEPIVTNRIKANLIWLSKQGFIIDESIRMRLSTQEVNANITCIKKRIDSSSLEVIEEDATRIGNLEIGEVEIRTEEPIVVTKFNDIQELGRFVLVRGNDVVAGGINP
ncbi:GTP-binding protein [candidate division WOR-3 bacterium]|nr:GTP-binding protein [candidate division WOR-3 bacterium]